MVAFVVMLLPFLRHCLLFHAYAWFVWYHALCCVVLRCAALCCVVLRCAAFCCVIRSKGQQINALESARR
eukprot:gene5567-biopygen20744